MKVSAGSRILARTGIANPVDIAAARIAGLDDRFAAMTVAEPRDAQAFELTLRQVGHVDIENDRSLFLTLEAILGHSLHQVRGDLGGAGEIARAIGGQHQGHSNGGQAQKSSFNGSGHGAEGSGSVLRRMQSGRVQQYGSLLFGATFLLGLALILIVQGSN